MSKNNEIIQEKEINVNNDWKNSLINELNAYVFEETLPGSKRVIKFKPIKTKTLKNLLMFENSREYSILENALDSLINDSVISEDFNLDNLYLQDRVFLLLSIRIRSKGSTLEIKETCKECKSQYLSTVDFSVIKNIELKDDYVKEVIFSKKNKIFLDFVTRREQKEIFNILEKKKNLSERDKQAELTLLTYAQLIKAIQFGKEVKEDLSLSDKLFILESTPESILNSVKDWYSENDFGIDLSYKKVCPHCNYTEEIEIEASDIF